MSIREVECWLNAKLFLNKYPRWGIQGPHQSIIPHSMFLHATQQGQKEVERLICWGRWQNLPRPDPEADITTMQLLGYQTSQKEVRDLYQEVYLLRSLTSPLPCRPRWREEAIQDILSSLRSCLHRWGGTAMLEEDQWGLLWLPPALLPTEILFKVPKERRLTWRGSPRGQRDSPTGIGGFLHAGTEYWKTEPGSRQHPIQKPPQLQQ